MAQYQHYIPQFILRNFSRPYQSPKGKPSKQKGRPRAQNGKNNSNKVLNVVDLAPNPPRLLQKGVSRWFGQGDMYEEVSEAIKSKRDVEQRLSKLESRAAEILHKVKKAFENNEAGIWLTRAEKDVLRKFLFIMKYRGMGFFNKYTSDDQQKYNAEDRHLLWDYMADKGFAKPRDVWLHNLRTILDLDMDIEGKWAAELPKQMFPADAEMFVFHIRFSYMAFCTPAEPDDEYLLTDQCYNLFEGPNDETFCPRTNEYLGNSYLCFHEFGPVSPRLMIILRSAVLPEALEDANPKVKEFRGMMFKGAAVQFPVPENVKSLLSDLPVAKATNSYSRVVNGRLELEPAAPGIPQSKDKFCFRFWPISTKHVDLINSIFLDNLLRSKSIVFNSSAPFKRTLEAYMTSPSPKFKTINIGEHGAQVTRLACLQKLCAVLKLLGSTVVPTWSDTKEKALSSYTQSFDDIWLDIIKGQFQGRDVPSPKFEESSFWCAYYKLGGSGATFAKDLDQSWRLYKLHALVLKLTQNLNDSTRYRAGTNVLCFILQNLPRRVWLYVKHCRWMLSDEYAMHQERYLGMKPLIMAKSESFFRAALEDDVPSDKPTADSQLLSMGILAAGRQPHIGPVQDPGRRAALTLSQLIEQS